MAGAVLSFRERLHLIVRALVGQMDLTPNSVGGSLLARIHPGASGDPPDRGVAGQLESYGQMPWVRACAGKIAASMAAVEWKLYVPRNKTRRPYQDPGLAMAGRDVRQKDIADRLEAGEVTEVSREHPFLNAWDRGNGFMPGVALRRVVQLHLDLTGEAFLLKERNRLGAPIAFWPIPPTWVIETATPGRRSFRVNYRSWQGEIPDTEVLWLVDPDPAQPYGRGVGYGKALADELETDEYAAKTTRQAFFNRAQPDFLVFPKGERAEQLPTEMKRFEQDWTQRLQGYWRAFKPYFLSREIGVYEFQKDFRALQLRELREFERNIIVQVFGIPPEKLGIIESSNRATIEAADLIMAKDVLMPRLEFLRSWLQERLIPEYDERLILDYVCPMTADATAQLEAAKAAPWAITVDEWRLLMGQSAKDDASGQLHMVPMALSTVEDLAEISVDAKQERERDLGNQDEPPPPRAA